MIVVFCQRCLLTIRVMGSSDEIQQLVGEGSEFWPDQYPCPRCPQKATGSLEHDVLSSELERLHVRDLTAQEAFAAFLGLGLPDERHCTREAIADLLREQPIRRIEAKNIEGVERCCIYHLELWDGTKVYFGAGAGGAVIYRVSPPFSYTENVSNELPAG
jgi:hypothetical protein